MDGELICNYKKCRKRLNMFAWVTSCSRENTLSGKFDVIRIDLQPNEQYKSMVLAGQKPETIMEICTRALSFWTYQSHQERTYQEYVATKAKERAVQLEQYYEQIVSRTQTELASLKTQLSATKKELDTTKKKHNEISDKLLERKRQYQKLQSLYDAMRRKCITPLSFEGNSGDASLHGSVTDLRRNRVQNFTLPLSSGDDILRSSHHQGSRNVENRHLNSPAEKEFVLRPNVTPAIGDISHDGGNSHSRFSLSVHTPK